ncbi:MAG: PstS family phosphate ABC transporter substrate-binding protein [Candidatus Omnitrophica bacterium]|nr:PstS family phosphate ABC transporter substrate-binding protein [Candidatus Omnitrophota bacterium]
MKGRGWLAGMAVMLSGVVLAAAETAETAVMVDHNLPAYQRVGGISGNLSSIGSDTLNNLMTFWAEGFARAYPNVKIQIEGKGSTTAPPALIAGTAQLGPMSRPMKSSEMDAFEKKYGYKPVAIGVALDALAVYVNKDNPIQQLSIEQVDAVFSSTRACGARQDVANWSQLGLSGEWNQPLSLYGRNSASGTYGYFKEHALCKGDYKSSVKEQPGSATVIEGVTNDRYAIGYSGLGYKTAGVRLVPLSAVGNPKPYEATADNVYAGTYPLSRYLYIYVNKAPGKPLDPLVKQFLVYVLSQEGQGVVVKDGFVPLANEIVNLELKKLE